MADITVVTRGSLLARTQTEGVIAALKTAHPGLEVAIYERHTSGDRHTDQPLAKVGGKGLFTAELEDALRSGEADMAVHSLKDLPTDLPADLCLGAIPARCTPFDALVLPKTTGSDAPSVDSVDLSDSPAFATDEQLRTWLPAGARVGTSSTRRAAVLRYRRPDLRIDSVRGNLDTRLRKLDEGQFDVLLLAAAGLERLGWGARITALWPPERLTPAPAQGALGIECRRGDARVLDLLSALNDRVTRAAVTAERAFLAELGGGCLLPVGAWARPEGEGLVLAGSVAHPDGVALMERTAVGPQAMAEELGRGLARELLSDGADRLLAAIE